MWQVETRKMMLEIEKRFCDFFAHKRCKGRPEHFIEIGAGWGEQIMEEIVKRVEFEADGWTREISTTDN
jgi:hypothetical protein